MKKECLDCRAVIIMIYELFFTDRPVRRKGEMTMMRFLVALMMASFLLLAACSKEDNTNYFPSREAALEDFIRSEGIKGSIDLIITKDDDELLAVQQGEKNYFVGELLEDKKGYTARRISANVVMELGGSWELQTNANHKYTIYFEKNQENQNFFPLSNGDFYISLIEGHQINKEAPVFTNSIKELKVVKE